MYSDPVARGITLGSDQNPFSFSPLFQAATKNIVVFDVGVGRLGFGGWKLNPIKSESCCASSSSIGWDGSMMFKLIIKMIQRSCNNNCDVIFSVDILT